MPRRASTFAMILVMLGVTALIAWKSGLLAPAPQTIDEDVAAGGAPSALEATSPGAMDGDAQGRGDGALAQGGHLVPKTKPPTIDGPRVTGKVIDRGGKPVGNARVIAFPDTIKSTFLPSEIGHEGLPVSDAVTGPDGKFVVAVSASAPLHALVAEAAGFAVALETQVAASSDVTLTLDRAGAFRGTVTDENGVALAGARVRLRALADAYRIEVEALVAADGSYRLEGVPIASKARGPRALPIPASLEATAEGFASVVLVAGLPDPGGEKEKNFILVRGAVVTGTVLDAESDRPVEGAKVVVWVSDGTGGPAYRYPGVLTPPSPYLQRIVGTATSDASGAFRVEHVPAQGFHPISAQESGESVASLGRVAAIKDGCCPNAAPLPLVKDGETIEVTIKLWGQAIVEGRAVDGAGAPVNAAQIAIQQKDRIGVALPKTLFRDALPVGWTTDVGADGKYRLAVPVSRTTEEDITVTGRFPRRSPSGWKQEGDGSVTVRGKGGATIAAPDLVLKPSDDAAKTTLVTRVRVLSPDGKPVWGATAFPVGNRFYGGQEQRTDADGMTTVNWFNSPQRPLTGPQAFQVTARGYARTPATANPLSTPDETVTVTMRVAHSIVGRVLKSDRTPAPGVSVSVGDGSIAVAQVFPEPRAPGTPPQPRSSRPPSAPDVFWGYALTDDDGRFAVESLPEGPYHVMAQGISRRSGPMVIGGGVAMGSSGARAVLSDVSTDSTSLELVLSADNAVPTGGVAGTARDAQTGRPPRSLTVTIRRSDEPASAWTEAGGPVSYFDAGGGNVMSMGGGLQAAIPSPGCYEFAAVPVGPWTVVAGGEGYTQRTVDVVVRAGETITVDPLELDHGTTLRGRARLPEGSDAKGRSLIFVAIDPAAGRARTIVVPLRDDATFVRAGFSTGRWRVTSHVQRSEKPMPTLIPSEGGGVLSIPDGAMDVSYEPTLVPSGSLSIQANDPRLPPPPWEGTPVTDEQRRFSDATAVTVEDASGAVVIEKTGGFRRDFAGPMSALSLLPGKYRVKIALPGEALREQTVDVTAGANTVVPFGGPASAAGPGMLPVPTAPLPPIYVK